MRSWLVSIALPIEAETPGDAVREYWRYLSELGPDELPVYVSPVGDELSLAAYLGDRQAPQDPED